MELKTNFFTPAATAASARFTALATLLRKYFDGSVIDSPTSALAAKWITDCAPESFTAAKISERSAKSPWTNLARGSTAERWPSVRLSNTVTAWPASQSSSTQTDPM